MKDPAKRLKTIIVEDSLRIQDLIVGMVKSVPGLELVAVADTAESALAGFAAQRPNIVILDLVLKTGNGLDVLHVITRMATGCQVLVFTAYDEEQYRTRCLAAGADFFLSKNRQHSDLLNLLQELGNEPREDNQEAQANDRL